MSDLGAGLGLVWALPFVGLILAIALAPLAAPRVWHAHFGKIAAGWALAFLLPFAALHGFAPAAHLAAEALLADYLPFVVLLGALYTVAGGVRLTGTLRGTPAVNTLLLLAGTLAASVTGTTGAALLLVRPLIRANRRRRHKRHVFVFFIFLVANIGGALSPLGDPPLFLGFIAGVPFAWPTQNLLAPMIFAGSVLLLLFFALDSYHHRRAPAGDPAPLAEFERLGVTGKINLVLLLAIVAVVMASGTWRSETVIELAGAGLPLPRLLAVLALLAIALLSLRFTRPQIRQANEFDWAPMSEVAILFAAIFITIAPVLAMLRAGTAGAAAALVPLVNPGGIPDDRAYFWATGLLSAVLDNAPTYLLFFNLAGGDAARLTGPLASTLVAISAGAVFFGALTYIGNAPNFMVRSIAERSGTKMPSFFGYVAWAALCLLPLFAATSWIFL
ncbi:MAG TPA: sodium:proton antiporter [Stellaceae bacterium]|nr:sodium:proton antiporter [Stellaceae bacterium]